MALCITPSWHYASNTSRREHKSMFIWTACEHAGKFCGAEPVDDEKRAEVEAKWNEAARKLFNRRTMPWAPAARQQFGKALGFIAEEPTGVAGDGTATVAADGRPEAE